MYLLGTFPSVYFCKQLGQVLNNKILKIRGATFYKRKGDVAMPRQARAKSSTGIYHCVLRGVDKRDVFIDDQDRYKFLNELKDAKEKCEFELYAYCLMDNHIHLLLKENDIKLCEIMHNLALRYSIYFNCKYERTGHLFQNRYFSKPIETEKYLLNVQKYIHQNPPLMQTYKWSSYKAYLERDNGIIDISFVLNLFDKDNEIAKRKFIDFSCKKTSKITISDYKDIEFVREIPDEKFIKLISNYLEINNVLKINNYNTQIRNDYLKKILDIDGASIGQISRIMGINKRVLSNIKNCKTCPNCLQK